VTVDDMYRLSFGQERLWLLQHLDPDAAGYNLVLALEFASRPVESALRSALDDMVTRHEMLRSVFTADAAGTPYRRVVDGFQVPLARLAGVAAEEPHVTARAALARPFVLSDGPPLRAVLVHGDARPDVLYLVFHHILVDARSLNILARELTVRYSAHLTGSPAALPPAPVRFADHVAAQRGPENAARIAADVEYWRAELDGVEPLRLPTDRPRTSISDRPDDRVLFGLSPEVTSALQRFALRQRCAVPSVIAAAFQVVLATQTGRSDITIGTVFTGRGDAALDDVVGFFVNTCALRSDLAAAPTGRALVRLVHGKLAAAHRHQDAPFSEVVATTRTARDADHNPLFDVLYVHHPADPPADRASAGTGGVRRLPSPDVAIRFDLELTTVVADRLEGALAFRGSLFERSTIGLLAERLVGVLDRLVAEPDTPVAELDRPAPAERGLLDDWNRTGSGRPPETLPAMFEAQVARTPDGVALDADGVEWTYRALDAAADRLARFLAGRGVGPEDLVAVALPRSADLVVAILGIGKAGAAFLPVDVAQPRSRVELMLRDAPVRCGITTSDATRDWPGPHWFALDELGPVPDAAPTIRPTPGHLAYVIFTSGSTGRPKGVAVPHAGLASIALTQAELLGAGPPARVLQQASPSFDVAIWEIIQALSSGATLVLPAPDLVMAGQSLADLLTGHRVTHATLTPTALRSLPVDPHALSDLRTLVVAGEACPPDLVDRWAPGRRMLDAYGPTESTICATVSDPLSPGGGAPIGRPVRDTRIHVLDARLREVPVGAVGEVYIAGAGLARGYLGPAGLTASRFVANPYGPAGSRMYRTGDLARWRADGMLDYLGRSDGQVKIRGFRVEPAEIESVLTEMPAVAGVAVLVHDDGDDRRLVAYVVPAGPEAVSREEMRAYASRRLPAYLVPSAFVPLDAFPLTASGKLDRRALPAPVYAATGSRRPPRSPREKILCEIFGEVLGVAPPGIDDGFFELGGHSLLATRLTSRIRSMLGVELPIRTVFEAPTVAQLAPRLDAGAEARPALRPASRPPRPPLSAGQRRLWFLGQLEAAAAYNIAFAMRLRGTVDVGALDAALTDVVDRHEILRTVYPEADGEPWQDVRPASASPPLTVLASTDADVRRELAAAAREAFDLRVDLPVRARLYVLGPDHHVLLVVAHHIAFDGWSTGPFRRELAEAYDARRAGRAPEWSPLPVQYVDFALWQRDLLGSVADPESPAARQLTHWTSQLAGAPPQTALPADRPRSATADASAELAFDLPAELHAGLRAVARDHQVTLFMTLQAALGAVLFRLGAGADIVIGTPVAGRTDDALDGSVGFFVNTLALRTDLSGDPTFGELLSRVRDTDLVAYANQDLPFEAVVEALNPRRVLGANPVFQVSLVLEEAAAEGAGGSFAGIAVEELPVGTGRAKFDMAVTFTEPAGSGGVGGRLSGRVEYRTDLYDRATIRSLVDRLVLFLEAVGTDPATPVEAVDLLSPAERRRFTGSAEVGVVVPDRSLPELLRRQVDRTPDGPAVTSGATTLTYRELDAVATRFAADLAARGVGLETPVAVAMERTIDLVVALVAILKAGGHYVPLPAGVPVARASAVVEDSGAALLLVDPATATAELRDMAAARGLAVLDATAPDGGDASWAGPARHPENLVYVMYTSGSSGVPKGVAVTDRDVATLVADGCWGVGPGDRTLFHAPHAFDASVYDLWVPLLNGGEVVVAPPGELDMLAIGKLIADHAVTTVHVTAGLFRIMAEECPDAFAGVREVLSGGDVVSPSAVRRLLDAVPGVRVRHLYGPTETTLCVTQHLVAADGEPEHWVPLGAPLDGTRLYVLDDRLRPVPPCVDGELYIGGAGLARGYLNRPGRTAERFVADPFGPPGSLMYRTGDVVRRTGDGQLRFLGRGDTQVKINGFRVEPEEIEAVLAGRPDVAQAVVVARDDGRGSTRLLAYVVPAPGHRPEVAELRRHLGESLPSYMLPAGLMTIGALPLTSNAKVDRSALPEPPGAVAGGTRGPRTLREQVLCRLFGEVLGRERVGAEESFFDLGGHSLLAMRLLSRIRAELHVDASIRVLFEAPTVAALALRLDADPSDPFAMVLPLRVGGTGAPVFLIHPIGGLSWCYSRFLPYIPPGHPVYGLQLSGYLGRPDRPESIGQLVAEYTARIRESHPHGPYALVGWSFGGLLAHEIAVELSAHGDVPVVLLLDAAPSRPDTRSPDDVTLPAGTADAIAVSMRGAAAGMDEALTGGAVADLTVLAEHCVRLVAGHRTRRFDGSVISVEASGSAEARRTREPWSAYARGGVRTHVVDCAHDQMMDAGTVERTGPILAEAIRRRLGGADGCADG
jgi:pristinamycin I synthase-3/4